VAVCQISVRAGPLPGVPRSHPAAGTGKAMPLNAAAGAADNVGADVAVLAAAVLADTVLADTVLADTVLADMVLAAVAGAEQIAAASRAQAADASAGTYLEGRSMCRLRVTSTKTTWVHIPRRQSSAYRW
jgi:hypothetical protein